MRKIENIFYKNIISSLLVLCSILLISTPSESASRAPARKTVASTQKSAPKQEQPTAKEQKQEDTSDEETINVENKSSQFTLRSEEDESDSSDSYLAETIRKQRAALEAEAAEEAADSAMKQSVASGSNKCDKDLRACVKTKCGNDFAKCAKDGDTDLGIKYDACRSKTKCSAEEFSLFTKEITEDIRFNAKISSYDKVISCGNSYNDCIISKCGKTFNNCLGKAKGDEAISKCSDIAKQCTEQDSGLVSRIGEVFGSLRQEAEKDVKKDESRMYELRDLMRAQCERLGAMFDERSFDCVYTVNFFAGEDQSKPMASRKAYAGSTFTCMQEWFGINVTTFKENAYRLTKSQTEASSAMLGSGLGTAVGTITSGAIDRAVDTQKAKKELDKERVSQGLDTLNTEKRKENQALREAKQQERQEMREGKKEKRLQEKANNNS